MQEQCVSPAEDTPRTVGSHHETLLGGNKLAKALRMLGGASP